MTFLERLRSATRIGNTAAAIRRLGLDAKQTIDQLFDLYHQGELSLVLSPDKTLIFRTRQVTEAELESITGEINARVDEKMRRFDQFVALIESGADPEAVLRAEFGAC
jgi:hypothetical protein